MLEFAWFKGLMSGANDANCCQMNLLNVVKCKLSRNIVYITSRSDQQEWRNVKISQKWEKCIGSIANYILLVVSMYNHKLIVVFFNIFLHILLQNKYINRSTHLT